jgi:tetratricopeptide (TPR) repeat protein
MAVAAGACSAAGADERASGVKRVSDGNELFSKGRFIDAAVAYEQALASLKDPIVHHNLGVAYSKIFRAESEQRVLLGTKNELQCRVLPGVKMVTASACVNDVDRPYAECGAARTAPIEQQIAELNVQMKTANENRKEALEAAIKEKRLELDRHTCAAPFPCVDSTFCSLTSTELADLAAQHLQIWIEGRPSDGAIREHMSSLQPRSDEAGSTGKSVEASTQGQLDDPMTADQTRRLMTRLWIDSDQYSKALAYWEGRLQHQPKDAEIMSILAAINLKAGDWRKSIAWSNKEASAANERSLKVTAYQSIGYVAWSKLNTRTLAGADAVELADRGIAALQRAAEIEPDNSRVVSLQASLFNFRAVAHGSSWAAAIDRASARQLFTLGRILHERATNASAPAAPATTARALPAPASGSAGTPPAPPRDAPPTAIERNRIAGDKDILPDDVTKTEIAARRVPRVIGTFKLCLDSTGDIADVKMLKSTGFPAYDVRLQEGIRTWKYRPFLIDGKPTPVCTVATFIYSQN